MGEVMKLTYDRVGDILYLRQGQPHAEQVMREVAEGVYALVNRRTGVVEGYEIQGVRARPDGLCDLELPWAIDTRCRQTDWCCRLRWRMRGGWAAGGGTS